MFYLFFVISSLAFLPAGIPTLYDIKTKLLLIHKTYSSSTFIFPTSDPNLHGIGYMPSLTIPSYKKLLIIGGLYGNSAEAEKVLFLAAEFISGSVPIFNQNLNLFQIDFIPVVNYKVYNLLQNNKTYSLNQTKTDLSFSDTCPNNELAGIDPDQNFNADWSQSSTDKCSPGYAGLNPMQSYVTNLIPYKNYDFIFNFQNEDKDFVCGPPKESNGTSLGLKSKIYDLVYSHVVMEYQTGSCYDIIGKSNGSFINYVNSLNIGVLQISDRINNSSTMNPIFFIQNITNKLCTGPVLLFNEASESINAKEGYYSDILFKFDIGNTELNLVNMSVSFKFIMPLSIFSIYRVNINELDLDQSNEKELKKIEDLEGGLSVQLLNETIGPYKINRYIFYMQKNITNNNYMFICKVDMKFSRNGIEYTKSNDINSFIIPDNGSGLFNRNNIGPNALKVFLMILLVLLLLLAFIYHSLMKDT